MTVDTVHPEYAERKEDWDLIRDSLEGERVVKREGEKYLPMPSGFLSADDGGAKFYRDYQKRARFGEYLTPTVAGMLGVIHSSEEKARIEIPTQLEYLWESSDGNDTPLESFHQSLTEAVLSYGRAGVQVTAPSEGGDPYLALWGTHAIVNWDEEFVVLDDSQYERSEFVWTWKEIRRVISSSDSGVMSVQYKDGIKNEDGEIEIKGVNGSLSRFPFILVNPFGVGLELKAPPVLGVARAAVSEYQLSADYRWQLYMSGQETLVVINADAPTAVGAGVVIELKGETDGKQPDAKYVGPSGSGISAHQTAMKDERDKAVAAGAKLLYFDKNAAESGDALRTRFKGHAATLMGVAQASCRALERALRVAGEMRGLGDDAINRIVVTPPKDLEENMMSGTEAEAWTRVWEMGGFSSMSLHERLQRGGAISPDRTFEEEQDLIEGDEFGEDEDETLNSGIPS